MTKKEVSEIIAGMEVSADTMLKASAMLDTYEDNDEVPEDLINEILKVMDADFDPAKVVEDSDLMP